jgi:serine/threonine protein phosphatase PrpC
LVFLEQGNIESAIRKGYIEFDKEMSLDEDMREDLAGTTAVCVVIKDQKLFCVCVQNEEDKFLQTNLILGECR